MKRFSFLFVLAVVLSALFLRPLRAQTELMQDVDAVKENNEDDLYTPDDEAANSSAKANTPAKKSDPTAAAPAATPAPAPNSTADNVLPTPSTLDDLPVDSGKPNSALTGVDAGPSAQLTSIRIYTLGDRTRYEIQTSKVVDYAPESLPGNKQFVINFANTTLGPLVSREPISAADYAGPVKEVQAIENKTMSGNTARVVMQLTESLEPSIRREGNRLLVDFYTKAAVAKTNRLGGPAELPDFETLMSLSNKQSFTGTKVNFKAKDAAIPDVLQFLSQVSGKNFVLAGESDKKISMNVKNIPWDQVLALVLLNADLGYQKMGNTYRVMPVTKIRQEIADSIKAQDDEDKLAPKATQLFPLSYAKTTEVVAEISKFLKPEFNESVVSDDRTNSVAVTALPRNIQRIRRYMDAIDKQTPVIQIEARIVQASKDFTRDIGINWDALGQFKIANGVLNFGGALGQANSSSAGSAGVTLGTTKLGGTGGGFSGYRNSGSATLQQLDALINFNETKNGTRELSRPSLTVLNNKKASVIDGTEYTFVTQALGGADTSTTKTVKANLSLVVTPQVTNDNNIILNLDLTRDSLGTAPSSLTANIPINKREIATETLVESGATVVIGGVYIKTENTGSAGWPFLKDLPIFGKLFTSDDSKFQAESELLMFISPRVLNLEKASVYQQSLQEAR